MTACAMTVGMVPMALALERGSQMQAPLGRAVIGGLVMSTFATLLVLPSVFALVIGRKAARSPSIYPDDPESVYYDPRVFVNEEAPRHRADSSRYGEALHDGDSGGLETDGRGKDDDVLAFLRRILDEARSKRHDMVTHYTVDDLRVALGFAKPGSDEGGAPGAGRYASAQPHSRAMGQAAGGGDAPGSESDAPSNAPPHAGIPDAPARPVGWRSVMRRSTWSLILDRSSPCRLLVGCLLAALAAPGCGHQQEAHSSSVSKPPTVRLIQPQVRSIVRVVGQPSFIESYERTSIYPKLTGYIEKWYVDIGDKVKKGQVLATLFVPEVVEDFRTKKAAVKRDEKRVELAHKLVDVADADLKEARARLEEARSILAKYQAEVDRWDSEVNRLQREVERGVVDPQILLESTKQLKSAIAARDAARATVAKVDAEVLSREAVLAKAKVDVEVAKSDLEVSISDAKRLEAWVGYITLSAPYDGVIVARNANTGDFVVPAAGDLTAMERAPYLAPAGHAAPIYVVDRTDVVRIFVDIPEQDANYVHVGTKATVLAQAYSEDPIPGTVTRTSWALNVKSRTLRAEIDLPNPGSQLLPGMYAYAKVSHRAPRRPGATCVRSDL